MALPSQLRDSPEYGGSRGGETVTYKYRHTKAAWKGDLPEYNATRMDGNLGTVYFQSWVVRPDENEDDYIYLDLTYSDSPDYIGRQGKEDNDDLYLPSSTTFEKPLEKSPNYLMCWNYNLYGNEEYEKDVPGWASSAKTEVDADGSHYKWAKESPGDGWLLLKARTKPGIENFLAPTVSVRYMFWHATKAIVEAKLQTVAKLKTPGETFGYSGDWLVTGVQIDEDGNRYRGTVEYLFAEPADPDLYEAAVEEE